MKRKVSVQQFVPPLLALTAFIYLLLGDKIGLPAETGRILYPIPFVLATVFAFLAVRLNQTTLFFIGVHFILAYLFLSVKPSFLGADLVLYARLYTTLTPLSLVLFYLLSGGLFDTRGSLCIGIALGLPLLLLFLYQVHPGWIETVLTLRISPWPLGLPQLGFLLIPILVGLLLLSRRWGFFEISLLWTLPPLFFLYQRLAAGLAADLDLSAVYTLVFLILLYALYRLYWHRVYLDELTGLYNRRAFDERLRLLGRQDSLAMIDIDHFKMINDTHGHQEGDNILRWIAKHLSQSFGSQAFRFGGEEFAVIFPHMNTEEAGRRLDAARQSLADSAFYLRSQQRKTDRQARKKRGSRGRKKRIGVTFSGGIASGGGSASSNNFASSGDSRDTLHRADQALYKAKEAGRNRIIIF